MMNSVTLKTPAKVNLFLNVSGKQKSGFHLIETLFQAISIFDIITVSRDKVKEPKLRITGRFRTLLKQNGSDNLVLKARDKFYDYTKIPPEPLAITLEKNIPVSAGLGGGSSDAAAMLTALNKLYRTKLKLEEFYELGRELGSDVNFFFLGGTQLGFRRGDKLQPIPLKLNGNFIVLYPNLEISAKNAYQNLEKKVLTKSKNDYIIINLLKNIKKETLFDIAKNDLQTNLIKRFPILGELTELLRNAGARIALVSGSGSSVFGYFDTPLKINKIKIQKGILHFLARKCWGVAKR
ncbi:MAG TPA: 4-(cytidine 5'-diphospho)-2-C-methyl-D-erythritol kinase [Firmicutes bacterium]|nr:4-(cytidine 5'-diphospho)-2-C-methyl-D-erythritol kinase [Bacillota bacterium]